MHENVFGVWLIIAYSRVWLIVVYGKQHIYDIDEIKNVTCYYTDE